MSTIRSKTWLDDLANDRDGIVKYRNYITKVEELLSSRDLEFRYYVGTGIVSGIVYEGITYIRRDIIERRTPFAKWV